MVFSIDEYIQRLFLFPLLTLCISVLILIAAIVWLLRSKKIKQIIVSVLFIVSSVIAINGAYQNLKYGFPLSQEDTSQTSQIIGEITKFERAEQQQRFMVEGEYVVAYLVTIDGEEYYFMPIGDLEIGDEVIVKFLPKSQIVIEFNIIN